MVAIDGVRLPSFVSKVSGFAEGLRKIKQEGL